jgi:DNA-binding ferritin-like protein
MLQLAVLFRALQLFSHSAHNLCSGNTFHEDHAFFGSIYGQFEGYYDSIIERLIGFGYESHLELGGLISEVSKKLVGAPSVGVSDSKEYYIYILSHCDEAASLITDFCKSDELTEGTKQLLGGMADELEVLKYKISRRIK